ncbi:MAG: hypothetical protein CMF31_03470 [Kordiimonas sp.]|nr:hypothetical protein [Kordiimonas sp.]|tara:strand:+ start:7882 stop:8850 length:969 start_codon:yes stop_codon:yes gene_type:complete
MTKIPSAYRRQCPPGGRFENMVTRDGLRLRTAQWHPADRADSRGTVVLLQGHREFIEKYFEFIHDWLGRGYSVYTLDLRGQGLSDGHLQDRRKNYVPSFDLYLHDAHDFIVTHGLVRKRQPSSPLILVGHSQGGHLALRYLRDHPGVFDKAIVMAPMVNIHFGNEVVETVASWVVRANMFMGKHESHAPGQAMKTSPLQRRLAFELLTHDRDRFADQDYFFSQNPALHTGGATYGWLDAALKSIARMQTALFAESISIPVLMLLAGQERIVNNVDALSLADQLPDCHVVLHEQARHEIYKETDDIRQAMWDDIDRFLGYRFL